MILGNSKDKHYRDKERSVSQVNMQNMQIAMHKEKTVTEELDVCVSALCSPVLKFFYVVIAVTVCTALFSSDINVVSTIDEYFSEG